MRSVANKIGLVERTNIFFPEDATEVQSFFQIKPMHRMSQMPAKPFTQVWESNFHSEMQNIKNTSQKYKYITVDTEFPGFLPDDIHGVQLNSISDTFYHNMHTSINKTCLIQLGLSFTDKWGKAPPDGQSWQLNFKFYPYHPYHSDAINLLQNAGIDFNDLQVRGIDHIQFIDAFKNLGLLKNPAFMWISYHGCYDFGYLLKYVTKNYLPSTSQDFCTLFKAHFPRSLDVRQMALNTGQFLNCNGLDALAAKVGCTRQGVKNNAASDAMLASDIFFRVRRIAYRRYIPSIMHNALCSLDKPPFGKGSQSQLSKTFLRKTPKKCYKTNRKHFETAQKGTH